MYMMYNAVASLRVGYFPCMQNVFCEIVSLGTFLIAACHNNTSFFPIYLAESSKSTKDNTPTK